MAKLTKSELKAHAQAVEILAKDKLTEDEKEFVYRNWHEGANHVNSAAGAFFTPFDMAFPQMSAGFNYSGRRDYERQTEGKAVKFQELTGLHFDAGCGVDTAYYREEWKGVSPLCEIVCVDFEEARQAIVPEPANDNTPLQPDLFGAVA